MKKLHTLVSRYIGARLASICIALVGALVVTVMLEVSVFNLRHWSTRFISPGSVNALEYDGYRTTITVRERDVLTPPGTLIPHEIYIAEINHPIRTVFVNPLFTNSETKIINVTIRYHDENTLWSHSTQIINGYTPSFHIPLGAMGDVDSLTIVIQDMEVDVLELYFNAPLPWRFQWARVILLTFAVSLLWLWRKHGFSKVPFSPSKTWQKCMDAVVVTAFTGLLFLVMFFSVDFGFVPGSGNEFDWQPCREYSRAINELMVDALLDRRLHLELEDHPHESLLNARYPHSVSYRSFNRIVAPWDHVFFNGRIYSYFGITPVVVLFLPYYVLRGQHLSNTVATFIFAAMAAVGIYFLWRELVKKYLECIPYTLYVAGLITALFGVNLFYIVSRGHQYETAIASGLAFSVWGLYLILCAVRHDSYEKIKARYFLFGGACLALAVGCRPTMLLASLVVPVFMWPTIRSCFPLKGKSLEARLNMLANAFTLAAPYVVIGTALAWYNFERFGSIFEFGATYQITAENVGVVTHTGFLGNLRRAFDGFFVFMFSGFSVQLRFPFVSATHTPTVFTGYMARNNTIGAFMLPVTWFLPAVLLIRKRLAPCKAMLAVIGMFATGLLIAVLSTVLIGTLARYTVDFFWLIILSALVGMGLVHSEARKLGESAARGVRRLAFAVIIVSCFVLFGWGVAGEVNNIWANNPVVFRFLTDLFVIF